MTASLAVLLSGRGSNFRAIEQAVADKRIDASIGVVISNRPDAAGIEFARAKNIDAHVIDHRAYGSREEHETEVLRRLDDYAPSFICLAGYMRRLTPSFVNAYRNRIINIHPSLLPSFPGIDAHEQAIAHGVKVTGCTVHFVDDGVDTGPIIVQKAIDVRSDDTAGSLSERMLPLEHAAYVEALTIVCSGRFRIDGRRVVVS